MDTASWQGPPADVLGQVVPIQQVIARTDHTVVALHYLTAFPGGCLLTLRLAVRRGSLDDRSWQRVSGDQFGAAPGRTATSGGLKFGIRLPDGSRATTMEHAFDGWAHPSDRPEPPMLVAAGGESSSNDQNYDSQQRFWLWPLPPPEPFEFVVEWQDLGVALTATTLDGSAVVRAAAHAVPFAV